MNYHLKSLQSILKPLFLLLLIFLFIGPLVSYSPIQKASLAVNQNIRSWVRAAVGPQVDALKENLSQNPIQVAMDRGEQDYARAFEAATGEEYVAGEECLTMFGLIPLNCPDPSGNGVISRDSSEQFSVEECMAVLKLPANLCRQW